MTPQERLVLIKKAVTTEKKSHPTSLIGMEYLVKLNDKYYNVHKGQIKWVSEEPKRWLTLSDTTLLFILEQFPGVKIQAREYEYVPG